MRALFLLLFFNWKELESWFTLDFPALQWIYHYPLRPYQKGGNQPWVTGQSPLKPTRSRRENSIGVPSPVNCSNLRTRSSMSSMIPRNQLTRKRFKLERGCRLFYSDMKYVIQDINYLGMTVHPYLSVSRSVTFWFVNITVKGESIWWITEKTPFRHTPNWKGMLINTPSTVKKSELRTQELTYLVFQNRMILDSGKEYRVRKILFWPSPEYAFITAN